MLAKPVRFRALTVLLVLALTVLLVLRDVFLADEAFLAGLDDLRDRGFVRRLFFLAILSSTKCVPLLPMQSYTSMPTRDPTDIGNPQEPNHPKDDNFLKANANP